MTLYTNSSSSKTIRNAFYNSAINNCEVLISSPFFSYSEIINEILNINTHCKFKIIVRLGPATSPDALQKIIHFDNILIRYFTSQKFHSKIYIFPEKSAIIGSANLTNQGFQSNNEVCVELDISDYRFDEITKLFYTYWDQAEVLTNERLHTYATLFKLHGKPEHELEKIIIDKFGESHPKEGISVNKKPKSYEKSYLEHYRRTYQHFHQAFKVVCNIYKAFDKRHHPENIVPLRIEIDQFFSFVREIHATGEKWLNAPILPQNDLELHLKNLLQEWFSLRWKYLDTYIPNHIEIINNALSSKDKIYNSTYDQIYTALDVCHSIHDRFRFFNGGEETQKEQIMNKNNIERMRYSLSYLLYGDEEFITRMGKCIFDDKYTLHGIGRSGIQELLGWVNKEDIPICNGRTVKALRYIGFDITTF